MNLLERTRVLGSDLQALGTLRSQSEQANEYERRASEFEAPALALAKFRNAVSILRERGVEVSTLPKTSISALRNRVADVRRKYLADKTSILNPYPTENLKIVLIAPLNQLPGRVQPLMERAWKQWTQSQLPKIDSDVLNVLGSIPALKASVGQTIKLLQDAQTLADALPTDVSSIARIEQLAEGIQNTWHALTGDGVPTTVLQFLRAACSSEGANHEYLTSEVLDWLVAHELKNSLRVRMG